MKFTCTVDINLSRERVIELWDSHENLDQWQDGYIDYEHISGTPGQLGAKSKFRYKMGRGEMELLETIINSNLPHEFAGLYEAKSMVNTMTNRFSELADNKTRWSAEVEYTELNGFMIKLMVLLMPGMFKKQVQKWLNQFKAFAENASK